MKILMISYLCCSIQDVDISMIMIYIIKTQQKEAPKYIAGEIKLFFINISW